MYQLIVTYLALIVLAPGIAALIAAVAIFAAILWFILQFFDADGVYVGFKKR